MCGRQPRNRHSIGRTTDIIQPKLVAKFNRVGIASVFTTDTQLDVGPCPAPSGNGLPHQRSDALSIKHGEGIRFHDVASPVVIDEFCRIVAGQLRSDRLYEDASVLAFRDIHPLAPLHALVIPKRHIATLDDFTDEDGELLGKLMLVAKRIAADHGLAGYRVAMNVNSLGGQDVFHAHLHVLGGRQMARLS